jgi:hypothetical protein
MGSGVRALWGQQWTRLASRSTPNQGKYCHNGGMARAHHRSGASRAGRGCRPEGSTIGIVAPVVDPTKLPVAGEICRVKGFVPLGAAIGSSASRAQELLGSGSPFVGDGQSRSGTKIAMIERRRSLDWRL